MEILQTIWNSLTTENEMLINIILIPFTLIEAIVCMLLFTTILNISSTTKQKILYVSILSLASNIIKFFTPTPINVILNLLLIPFLIIVIFKTRLLKALVAEIIPYIFIAIIELFLSKPLVNINNITMHELQVIPIYRLTFVLFGYLFMFAIYLIIRNSNLRLTDLSKIHKKDKTFLLLTFSLGLVVVFLQTYLTNFYNENLPSFIGLINFLIILSYFFISFYRFDTNFKIAASK